MYTQANKRVVPDSQDQTPHMQDSLSRRKGPRYRVEKLSTQVPFVERLLTVDQVAERWQISPRSIRRMIADGRLPVVRIGRAVRIREKEVAL